MNNIAFLAPPQVEPVQPDYRSISGDDPEGARRLREFMAWCDTKTREKVALLVSVLGLSYLADLCIDCAAKEIIELMKRPDVYALVEAYERAKRVAR
jgi:hypothetical protein